MKTSHKLILSLSKTIMVLSASIFVVSIILLTLVLRPKIIKQWLDSSGLYGVTATEIRSQAQESLSDSAANSLIVNKALEKVITAERIQSSAEKGVDNTFTWLEGQGDEPRFEINEAEIRSDIANQVVAALGQRAKQLPACNPQSPPLDSDIFTINCLPPGVNIEEQLAEVKTEITQFSTTEPDQSTVGQNTDSTNTIVAELKGYRQAYQWLQIAPIITGLLFVIGSIVTLVFIKPKYKFFRVLGLLFLTQAVLYLFAGWLTPRTVKSSGDAILSQAANTPFATSVQNISLSVTNAISDGFVWAGLITGTASIVLLITYVVLNKKLRPRTTASNPTAELNNSTPSSS